MRSLLTGLSIIAASLAAVTTFAAESSTGESTESFNRRWLRDLNHDDFRVREDACARIVEAGAEAIEPLKQAASDMDRETAARCLGVLERLARDPEEATARRAKETLAELESSKNEVVADLARAALVKTEKLPTPSSMRVPVRPFPMGFNIRVQGAPGGPRWSSQTINGHRTITSEVAGTKVVIEDTNGRNIRITVIETVNGAEKKTEYRGTDLDDLRKQSPAGAEVYDKHSQPGRMAVAVPRNNADAVARMEKLRELTRKRSEMLLNLHELRRNGQEGTPEFKALEEKIEKSRNELREALGTPAPPLGGAK
ncbi:MAG TPA: hypothetical protein VM510_08875 [Caulifigura sp.]|jgi:hypothetical protein|nr:hypothetical protein [Caulifigura sp.]